ncbi:TetR/AcrR family transcriptional regulator [Pseudomonas sp. F1_0610]|uniref:TetR/AcrR family transcriptional regulator n=1 Tax=Pseudomonas sp. F1_0610 TaxID=3114284 RepID=UPI0039C3B4CC
MKNSTSAKQLLTRQLPQVRDKTKKDILLHALDLFNTQGISQTTIEQIKQASGNSIGTIYHHFKSKQGLIAYLYQLLLHDQQQALEAYTLTNATVSQTVEYIIYSYIDWASEYPDFAIFQFNASASTSCGEFSNELNILIKQRVESLLLHLTACPDASMLSEHPPELLPALIIGTAHHYARAWLEGRTKQPPTTYREYFAQAAINALTLNKPTL